MAGKRPFTLKIWRLTELFYFVSLTFASSLVFAQDCKLKLISDYGSRLTEAMKVGEVKDIGPFSVRLDAVEPGEPLDKYQVSVKDNSTGAILLNHGLVPRLQSIQITTRCGNLTLGADRTYSTERLPISITLALF